MNLPVILAFSVVSYILRVHDEKQLLYPDSVRYLRMAKGERMPPPFSHRILLPWMLKTYKAWRAFTATTTILLPLSVYSYLIVYGLTPQQAAVGALMMIGLGGVSRWYAHAPVLVDSPSLLLSILSAGLFMRGETWTAVFLTVVNGLVKESSPVFTLLFSLNPLSLTGFLPLLFRKYVTRESQRCPDETYAMQNRVKYGLLFHRGTWFNVNYMLFPWGLCVLGLLNPSWWLAAALAVGYGQLLISTDTVRLYQLTAPVVVLHAAQVIPFEYAALLLTLHCFNPWQGDCRVQEKPRTSGSVCTGQRQSRSQ